MTLNGVNTLILRYFT